MPDAHRPGDPPPGPPEAGSPDPWSIAAALVTAPTLEEQLTLLLQEAPRVAGGGGTATAYLPDTATGDLRIVALYGYTPVRDSQPRPRGMTSHVLESGEVIVVKDATTDPRVNPIVPASGIRSVVALPLAAPRAGTSRPVPLGVLYVNSTQPHAFGPESVEALRGLAALAAIAIENTLLHQSERDAASRLQDALAQREQFVSVASHELKAPLTPLKGYVQAITRRLDRRRDAQGTQGSRAAPGDQAAAGGQAAMGGPIDEAWLRRALDVMVVQIDRLDRLVTDLLDAALVRAGRFTIEPVPLDFVTLARETFDRFCDATGADAPADSAARHTFHWQPETESLALPGTWDRTRLDQLITNLLTNAVKYSPSGGAVTLRVAAASPDDPVQRHHAPHVAPGWVHLSVSDQGIGLPNAAGGTEAPGIFDAFTRGENAAAADVGGFGLGLFICSEIARRHGGAIWAESPGPNQGATFHVLLPPHPLDTTDTPDT